MAGLRRLSGGASDEDGVEDILGCVRHISLYQGVPHLFNTVFPFGKKNRASKNVGPQRLVCILTINISSANCMVLSRFL
uniref:Uncharacterized protein n=1 Tax=Setaria italica TaxID=4555 RepID=K3ZKQ2_SETIT